MNEFVDMHVHSKFSIDGMSTMEDYCLIAGKTGTRVICFTEHVDFNSAEKNLSIVKDNRKQNFVVDDYFREINRLRKKYGSLTLLSGIEFSEPSLFPEEFALYSSYPFDCITAGIHHCYNSVFPGAGNLSVSKAIYEYYQIMQKTVELGGFQVLAHLDFPKLFFDKWVIDDDVLDMILSTMIDKNILLEVNTSSLNDSCDEPMPSYDIETVAGQIRNNVDGVSVATATNMVSGIAASLDKISGTVSVLIIVFWLIGLAMVILIFTLMMNERKREFASLRAMGASRGILSGIVVKEALTVNLLGGMLGIALSAVILFSFSGLIGESLGAGFVLPSIMQTAILAVLALLSVTVSAALAAGIAGKKVNQMDASLVLKEGE